jgi:YVTN family beta-propeller protein
MLIRRWSLALGVMALWAICISCGQNYRLPIIQIPGDPGDPKLYHFAVTISTNDPTINSTIPGSAMQIDVVGDSDVAEVPVGRGPIYATLLPTGSANRIYVANSLEDTVSTTTAAPVSCSPGPVCPMGAVVTVTMPAGSAPSFLNSTEASNMYVLLPGPTPSNPLTPPQLGVISVFQNALSAQIALPSGMPVAMVELPNGRKMYVVDQANNAVYVIDTVSHQLLQTIPVGASPTKALASPDSSAVYVMTAAGITVIDALTDSAIPGNLAITGQPNFIAYDPKLNRLYATDTSGGLGIFDAAVAAGNLPDTLRILPAASFPGAISIAPLPDGTRFYVLANPSGTSLTLTSVDSATFAIGAAYSLDGLNNPSGVPVSAVPQTCSNVPFRYMAGASGDSSRVYVSSCDAGGTYIFRTSDNTGVLLLPSPNQPPVNGVFVPQNPVFLITGR